MKKIILSLGTMLTLAGSTAFANNNESADAKAKQTFNSNFTGVSHVMWQRENAFEKATFTMNNQVMFAYFDDNGDLVATTRNILSDQLPIHLLTDLKKNYADHWITELFEIATQGETTYYVTLENAEETVVLRSSDFNNWSTYKKIKRS
jgi:hypothetical protein